MLRGVLLDEMSPFSCFLAARNVRFLRRYGKLTNRLLTVDERLTNGPSYKTHTVDVLSQHLVDPEL